MAGEKLPKSGQERFPLDAERLDRVLEEQIDRIVKERPLVGEGQVAQVYNIDPETIPEHPELLCIKVWRPSLKNLSPIEQKRRQYLSPEEEYTLQCELYRDGFTNIPKPYQFKTVQNHDVIVMERIPGYTLAELWERGGIIVSPHWKELERLIATLNNRYHVVHRDLHLGNIMLKTNQPLISERHTLSGELYLIDFGLSRRIMGTPTDEDYNLTIGSNVIRYSSDRSQIAILEPTCPGIPGSSIFLS